jgi:hypothetical protein
MACGPTHGADAIFRQTGSAASPMLSAIWIATARAEGAMALAAIRICRAASAGFRPLSQPDATC